MTIAHLAWVRGRDVPPRINGGFIKDLSIRLKRYAPGQ